MSTMQIAAQMVNGVGTIFNMAGINFKKKSNVLIAFTLGNACVATALGMLGAVSGMITQIIFVIETIINYFYEKKKGANVKYPIWMIVIYVLVPTIIVAMFFGSLWDLLPMTAGILFPLALISKELALRLLNLLSVALWIPYNFVFGQYVGAISCIIFTIVNFIAIVRLDIFKINANKE